MKRKGFTLIELVMVLVILGILAAILYPVFFLRPHKSSSRYECQSNLKQIGLGMMTYTQDYDEKYPIAKNSQLGLEKPVSWAGLLHPYIKNTRVFQCPRDETANDESKSSFAFNASLTKSRYKNQKSPSSIIMNFEVIADPNNWTQTGTGPQAVSGRTRHLDGANYSFADGHVKWLTPEKVTAGKPDGKNYTFAIQ